MKTNRKTRPQPSLASLTTDEYHQLADMVRTCTYEDILQQIVKPRAEGGFDLDISIKPLQVLHRRVTELDRVNKLIADGQKLTLTAYDELQAGQTPPTEQIHNAILNATWLQVQYSENTPHQLLALQRLADFPARSEMRENREQIYEEKHTHKIEMDTFRKEQATERLDLAKRSLTLREKTFAHRQEQLALSRLNLNRNPNLFSSTPENEDQAIASVAADDDDFDYENMPSISPNPLPPEVIARNLEFSRKLRAGKIIIDRSGPYVRAVELPDAPNSNDAIAPAKSQPDIAAQNNSARPKTRILVDEDGEAFVHRPGPCPLPDDVVIKNHAYAKKLLAGLVDPVTGEELPDRMTATESEVGAACAQSAQAPNRTSFLSRPPSRDEITPSSAVPADPAATTTPNPVHPVNPVENPSSPTALIPSQTLEERVDAYNNLRAQEYLAFDQQRSRLSKYDPFPPYVTQYRYCPCGNACPCPIHEDEEKFGQYFTFFWSLSPFHSVYADTLRARGLPYTKPKEDLP